MNDRNYSNHPLNGVFPLPDIAANRLPMVVSAPALLPGSCDVRYWSDYATPADDQGPEPSCVGRAWAGWVECMVRRYIGVRAIPPGFQIDARAIWRRGRELFWGGSLTGGLWIPQGLQAAVDIGVLPPGSTAVRIGLDWASVGASLCQTPLVQAHAVSEGWYNPSAENGCLDHAASPDAGRHGYHCTLLLDRMTRESKFYLFANSWGTQWGWNGLGLIEVRLWARSLMNNGLFSASIPGDFSSWRGWEKHVVKES